MTSPEQKKIGTAIYELPTEFLVSLSPVYFSAIHFKIPVTFGISDTGIVNLDEFCSMRWKAEGSESCNGCSRFRILLRVHFPKLMASLLMI